MKTISDHPLLVGQLLARAEARERERFARRNVWWRQIARIFGFCLRRNAEVSHRDRERQTAADQMPEQP